MNGIVRTLVAAVALLAFMVPATGSAHDDRHDNNRRLRTDLSGFNEVHPPNLGIGAIFSTGSGQLKLKIDRQNSQIHYELSYDFPDAAQTPLDGTKFVNQAHLHFGQKHTTGGITVWLCQADARAPTTDIPECPSPSGTVTGTIIPANIIALPPRGSRASRLRRPGGRPAEWGSLRERSHRSILSGRDPRPIGRPRPRLDVWPELGGPAPPNSVYHPVLTVR